MKGDLLAMVNRKLNSTIFKCIKPGKYFKNLFSVCYLTPNQKLLVVQRETDPNQYFHLGTVPPQLYFPLTKTLPSPWLSHPLSPPNRRDLGPKVSLEKQWQNLSLAKMRMLKNPP